MSQNDINITFRLTEDGTLQAVTGKTKKLAKETEKLTSTQDNLNKRKNTYNKQEKGAAQLTSNSTKAFSKQAQTIGGGGGLVPAYAALAANVFAVTAAFGVLQRAAAVEQLVQGMAALGRDSGYAMMTLSKGLKEATGNALSLEEAMRSTAMITSAGFDASTVEQIGVAAQKSAVALGRNTQESLERFTRGLVKMEAELLDELGLFPRVDAAAEEYARNIGKSASQLTQFEKRQAFANAALEEAQEKFGSIEVQTNPYDQLAASFSDLSKNVLNFLNAGIIPVVSFLSTSTGALVGVLGLFASTISQDLLGGLTSYAEKAKDAAREQKGMTKNARISLNSYNRSADSLTKLTKSLEDGSAANREYQSAINGQNQSMRTNARLQQIETISKKEYTDRIKAAKKAIEEINATQMRQRLATASNAEAKTIAALSAGKYDVALKNLKRTFKFYGASLKNASAAQGFFNKTLKIGTVVAKAAGASFRLLGAAVSALLGPISTAIALGSLLYEAFNWLRDKTLSEEQKALTQAIDDSKDPLKEIAENLKAVDERFKSTAKGIDPVTKGTIAYSNSLNSLNSQLAKFSATGASDSYIAQREALQGIISSSKAFRTEYEKAFGTTVIPKTKEGVQQAVDFAKKQELIAGRTKSVQSAFEGANKAAQEFFNSFKETTAFTPLLSSVKELNNSLKGALPEEIGTIIDENFAKNPAIEGLVKSFQDAPKNNDAAVNKLKALITKSQTRMQELTEALQTPDLNKDSLNHLGTLIATEAVNIAEYKKEIQDLAVVQKDIGKDEVARALEFLNLQNDALINGKRRVKGLTAELNLEKEKGDRSTASLAKQIGFTNLIIDQNLSINNIEIETLRKMQEQESLKEERLNLEERISLLLKQNKLLEEQRVEGLETVLKIQKNTLNNLQFEQSFEKMLLDIDNKRASFAKTSLALKEKQLQAAQKEANAGNVFRDYDPALSARDAYNIEKQLVVEKAQQLVKERELKIESVNMEYSLLEARLKVAQTEAMLAAEKSTDTDQKKRLNNLAVDLGTQIEGFAGLRSAAIKQVIEQSASDILSLSQSLGDKQSAAIKEGLAGAQTGSQNSRIRSFASIEEDLPMSQTIEAYKGMLDPMTETLSQLGPDGALAQSVVQGAFAISGAWAGVGEVFAKSTDGMAKGAAVAQAIGTTVSAVGNIMAENSDRQISAIDKQIAAEKARDGSSAKSLAKIKSLEKQKEQMERKRFEQQKKVQMATTIANTASAMMTALAAPPIGLGPINGIPLAGMAAAMGALQLAVIGGTSYDGGTSSAPSEPSSLTVGQRGTSTDLATSRGGAGELGYFRGQQGFGGAESFTPAFTGMKYRASGGETTGFMVGEQGPEMFVPEKPGRIVPADEVSQGTPINANINISAIDAQGVEEVLINQRGNIIGMIREAANANGETFLENVSTMEV